jgi:hypothetical protein
MKNIVCMATIIAASSGAALAADFRAAWTGIQAGSTNVTAAGFVSNLQGGYMDFNHDGASRGSGIGQFQNQTFQTFCIELQGVSTSQRDWNVVDVAAAPNPGVPNSYGAAIAGRINAIVAAAIRLGWIAGDLSGATTDQATTIQAGIWAAIGSDNATIDAGDVSGPAINTLWATLFAEYSDDTTALVSGLRAMTAPGSQDMLYVVPLPPAAFAGLATLVGIAGVSRLRRR